MAQCRYCGDQLPDLMCGGVIVPQEYQPTVCRECAERGDDWFHDSEMEDQ